MESDELIELLKGKDELQASLAMHEILMRPDALQLIAKLQDTEDPRLRRRIQQLSSLFNRGWLGFHFNKVLADEDFSFWDVLCQLNVILDQHASLQQIQDFFYDIDGRESPAIHTSRQLSQTLAGEFPSVNPHAGVIDYFVSDVLYSRVGAALTLAAIGEKIGLVHGLHVRLGMMNRRPVLQDDSFCVMDPQNGWRISHPNLGEFEPLSKKDFAVHLLTRVIYSSIIEQLHTVTYNAVALLMQLK